MCFKKLLISLLLSKRFQDEEERKEIEQLVSQLESNISEIQDEDIESEIDEQWLTDTNIATSEVSNKEDLLLQEL